MTRKAKRAVAITMLSIILIGLAFCISALAVSSVNGTTFTATVTEWWGVVVKAFSPSTDKPGVDKPGEDKPGIDNPGVDKPGEDKPGIDNPDTDKPGEDNSGEGTTAVCYDENGNLLKSGVRYAFQNSLNFAEASASATDGVTMTATIIPASALDKRVNWSVEWVDSTSDWAKGKTVTDYVTVTADTTDSRIATVNCSAPFGSQIKVVATSVANAEAKADCYVDYYKRGEDLMMEFTASYKIGKKQNYVSGSDLRDVDYDDVLTRVDKNLYSMKYIDHSTLEDNTYGCYGVSYDTYIVDNSIGTKAGLRGFSLKKVETALFFMEQQKFLPEIYRAEPCLFEKIEETMEEDGVDINNCRLNQDNNGFNGAKRDFKGPTIDSLNIKNCLGATFNDPNYEEIARTILAVTKAGGYHYEYIIEADDVLTGEKKLIEIMVRLDDSFIPEVRGVELDNGNIGF